MIPLDEVDRCQQCGAVDPSLALGHGHFLCPECNEIMLSEMYADQYDEDREMPDPVDLH